MQKFQTLTEDTSPNGCLQGYFTTTRREIEEVFGEPTVISDGWDKITVEWVIQFEDGTYASIYDYKRYEEGTPKMDEIYEWHIGGKNFRAAELISEAMGVPIEEYEMSAPNFRKKIYG